MHVQPVRGRLDAVGLPRPVVRDVCAQRQHQVRQRDRRQQPRLGVPPQRHRERDQAQHERPEQAPVRRLGQRAGDVVDDPQRVQVERLEVRAVGGDVMQALEHLPGHDEDSEPRQPDTRSRCPPRSPHQQHRHQHGGAGHRPLQLRPGRGSGGEARQRPVARASFEQPQVGGQRADCDVAGQHQIGQAVGHQRRELRRHRRQGDRGGGRGGWHHQSKQPPHHRRQRDGEQRRGQPQHRVVDVSQHQQHRAVDVRDLERIDMHVLLRNRGEARGLDRDRVDIRIKRREIVVAGSSSRDRQLRSARRRGRATGPGGSKGRCARVLR